MTTRELAKKRVLVTGASGGIGKAIARRLAALGAQLVLTARRGDRLAELQDEIAAVSGICHIAVGDITSGRVRQSIIENCEPQLGGLDILINNAGVGAVGRFDESSELVLRQIMDVNFFAPVELTRLALPLLKNGRNPMLVNIGSILGHRSVPLKSEYCASKFALHGWTDAIRAELVRDRVDVLLVSPSTTDSEFFENVVENKSSDSYQASRPMPPDYVAKKTIEAMQRGSHEIILPLSGKAIVWLDRLLPTVANKIVARKAQ